MATMMYDKAVTVDVAFGIQSMCAVSFIGILLLMAGIEQNPGPNYKFNFRYQCLLIEVGTKVVREIFDVKVGYNLGTYLSTNKTHSDTLQFLITGQKGTKKVTKPTITAEQAKLLPPIDNHPISANFDISLLTCLLRNICGLLPASDNVWVNPASTVSIEADIARLRQCRNKLTHDNTVRWSETEFDNKWKELVQVLNGLNKYCGLVDLPLLIDGALHVEIDERLKERYDKIVKEWSDMDSVLDKLRKDVEKLQLGQTIHTEEIRVTKNKLENVAATQTEHHARIGITENKVETVTEMQMEMDARMGVFESQQNVLTEEIHGKKDIMESAAQTQQDSIKQSLIEMYEHDCSTLPLLPLFEDQDDDLMKIYQYPSMHSVDYHKVQPQGEQKEVTSYKGILCKEDKQCQNVYITGDAGVGKTSFCKRMCLMWCMAKRGDKSDMAKCGDKSVMAKRGVRSGIAKRGNKSRMAKRSDNSGMAKRGDKSDMAKCGDKSVMAKRGDTSGMAKRGKKSGMSKLGDNSGMAKRGDKSGDDSETSQIDIDCMKTFDFVFYVSLRETDRRHVIDMIIQQLFDSRDMYKTIETVLRQYRCLVLLDGLDEWTPEILGKVKCDIPSRLHTGKCTYITTCRPYRIESVRLSQKDIDNHVQITGMQYKSAIRYLKNNIDYMNEVNNENRDDVDFLTEVIKCGLRDHLFLPILASNLVLIWFDKPLTAMYRAAVYGHSLEMLFKRAEKRGVAFPSSQPSDLQFPEPISNFKHINKHSSLINKICLLSFDALFKQNENATLVFTKEQLESELFNLSEDEQKFLYEVGVLSKNKTVGCRSEQTLKLSFIHKSYLEFFGALFMSRNDSFEDMFKRCTSLSDFMEYENFILLLAGLSGEKVKVLFDNLYTNTLKTDYKISHRGQQYEVLLRDIYSYEVLLRDIYSYINQLQLHSLQTLVVNCFKEVSKSNYTDIVLRLKEFFLDADSDIDILKQLLILNREHVTSIHWGNFDSIMYSLPNRPGPVGMLCHSEEMSDIISGIRSFKQLTSLQLCNLTIQHSRLHDLVKFLSDHVVFEKIALQNLCCDTHKPGRNECTPTLNLLNHTKLKALHLAKVDISCNGVNSSSLHSIILFPLMETCYAGILNCTKDSQLDTLVIAGLGKNEFHEMEKTLVSVVPTLSCIRLLLLKDIHLTDDVLLQLHPDVTSVEIVLIRVTMSREWFYSVIDSFVSKQLMIKVRLQWCMLEPMDGGTHRDLSKESLDDLVKYVSKIPSVKITEHLLGQMLNFETNSCP